MSEREKEMSTGLYLGNLTNGMHAVNLGVDGIILLERTLNTSVVCIWIG
jgi:hypothetical protein